jgi:hypothetical protein
MKYFLSETITLRRLGAIDINRSVFSATGSSDGYLASWQEPSPDKIALYEGEIGKTFVCFVDICCPVQPGDQIVKDGTTYSVRDIKVNEFGSTHYKRIIVVSKD